jgi:hypothetical protein
MAYLLLLGGMLLVGFEIVSPGLVGPGLFGAVALILGIYGTARVNAVAYFRVIEPVRSVIAVERFLQATSEISQTTLRSVLGKADLDTLLAERERLNENLQQVIDEQTEPWGVSVVGIKDVEIRKICSGRWHARPKLERNRRARVINAEAEFQAAERLHDVSAIISRLPTTLQLRYLQTLTEIGVNQKTTVAFRIPIDLLDGLRAVTHAVNGAPATKAGDPAPT